MARSRRQTKAHRRRRNRKTKVRRHRGGRNNVAYFQRSQEPQTDQYRRADALVSQVIHNPIARKYLLHRIHNTPFDFDDLNQLPFDVRTEVQVASGSIIELEDNELDFLIEKYNLRPSATPQTE